MSFHVTYNFVQGYDAGQKKIVASEMDQNFADIEGYINNSSVNIAETQTITGDKTFTGTVDLSGATVISSDNIPVGSIIWSANASVPAGYLLCNGASVGRDTYPELFAAIGTTYGEGDGSTTFNLPDLIGRFIEGSSTAGTVKEAGLPNITGNINDLCVRSGDGAFWKSYSGTGKVAMNPGESAATFGNISLNASRSSSIYGNSTTVQPPSVTALPCIKAFSSVIGDATVVAGQLVNDIQSKVALDGSNVSSIGSTLSTYMAHAAMPSGQYIQISPTGGAGTAYTAVADGYISVWFTSTANGAWAGLASEYVGYQLVIPQSGSQVRLTIPVSKDGRYVANWGSCTLSNFYFTYANGSAPTV